MGTLTRIEVVGEPGGRPACRFVTGHLSPRRLTTSDGSVRVALVAATALLLAGDEVRLEIVVDGPARLDLVETAGTVAYDMRGGRASSRASWDVDVSLHRNARLTWAGEPLVVSDGAVLDRSLRLDLDADCRAAVRESLVLGRSGETGGVLRASTRVTHEGRPLLVEDLDLSPDARAGWAVLGRHRCVETVSTYGFGLPDEPPADATLLQLAGAGTVVRRLGSRTHVSELRGTWATAVSSPGLSSPGRGSHR